MATVRKTHLMILGLTFAIALAVVSILSIFSTVVPVLALNQTNVTEQVNVTCTTAINVPDGNISAGTGFIPESCIDCWIAQNTSSCGNTTATLFNVSNATVVIDTSFFNDSCWQGNPTLPDGIIIRNKGNNFITLNITLLNDTGWNNQTGAPEFGNNSIKVFLQQGNATNRTQFPTLDDTNKSCLQNFTGASNATALVVNVQQMLCGAMAWEETRNEMVLFDIFIINPKTDPKLYTLTKRLTATEKQCGGTMVDPGTSNFAVGGANSAATPAIVGFFDKDIWGSTAAFANSATAGLSAFNSITGIPGGPLTANGERFMGLGINFSFGDFGTANGCAASQACGQAFAPGAVPANPAGISNFGSFLSSADSDFITGGTGGTTLGGTAVAITAGASGATPKIYLMAAHQFAGTGPGLKGDIYNGTFTGSAGSLNWTMSGTGAATNACAGLFGPSISCSTAAASNPYPSSICDAFVANNGVSADDYLWITYSDNTTGTGQEKLGMVRVQANTYSTVGSLLNIPGLASNEVIRNCAYDPAQGQIFFEVDFPAYRGIDTTDSGNDGIIVYNILRNGNDAPAAMFAVGQFWPANAAIGNSSSKEGGFGIGTFGFPAGFEGVTV